MKLTTILDALQKIAPLTLAANWDNVGLLLEPRAAIDVDTILLTIDLTTRVLEEAIARKAELVVAYHPPIFAGLKRLAQNSSQERALLKAIEHGIAIYSPHTALDATAGGLNDWLADGIGKGRRSAILPHSPSLGKRGSEVGQGRLVELDRPVSLSVLLRRIKRHLSLDRLRLALPAQATDPKVTNVALCAGAGASVLSGARAEVWLTGEMRHHDILAAVEVGTCVILTEHTNSERGYLPQLARRLENALAKGAAKRGVKVFVSAADAEPIAIV